MKSPSGENVPIYVDTNENDGKGIQRVFSILPATQGQTLVGVSGYYLIELFLARSSQVRYLINIDPHPGQKVIWDIFIRAVRSSQDPNRAKAQIFQMATTASLDNTTLNGLKRYFAKKDHFLATNRQWRVLKDAVDGNRVASVAIDLSNSSITDSFFIAMRNTGYIPDSVYLSNLANKEWLGTKRFLAILERIKTIFSLNTFYLIYSNYVYDCSCARSLCQRIVDVKTIPSKLYPVRCMRAATHLKDTMMKLQKRFFILYQATFKVTLVTPEYYNLQQCFVKSFANSINCYSEAYAIDINNLLTALVNCKGDRAFLNLQLQKYFPNYTACYNPKCGKSLFLFLVYTIADESKIFVREVFPPNNNETALQSSIIPPYLALI